MRVAAAAAVLLLSAAVTVTSAGRSLQDVVTEDGTYYTMSLYQASGALLILFALQHRCDAFPVLPFGTATRRVTESAVLPILFDRSAVNFNLISVNSKNEILKY